jgi:hypothetical protein
MNNNRKNFTTLMKFIDFLMLFFHQREAKIQPSRTHWPVYSMHGYSGWLGARSTSVEKALWTCSRHSMHFLIAARNRVNEAFFFRDSLFNPSANTNLRLGLVVQAVSSWSVKLLRGTNWCLTAPGNCTFLPERSLKFSCYS